MNQDDYDDYDDDETQEVVPLFSREGYYTQPFMLTDVACIGLRWVGNMFAVASAGLTTTGEAVFAVANCVGMDANYRRERRDFARSAGMTIESITGGSDGSD